MRIACIAGFSVLSAQVHASGDGKCPNPHALQQEVKLSKYSALSPETMIALLQALHAQKLLDDLPAFISDPSGKSHAAIEQFLGFPKKTRVLYQAVVKEFGSWDEALLVAKIHIEESPSVRGYKLITKDQVIEGIQALDRALLPLDGDSLLIDTTGIVQATLQKVLGEGKSTEAFLKAAGERFGSWEKARKSAGIPTMTSAEIVKALRAVHALGEEVPLNAASMQREKVPARSQAIASAIGTDYSNEYFYNMAVKRFGSWDAALRAAGINPDEVSLYVSKKHLQTKEEIIKAIHVLAQEDLDLHYSAVRHGKDGPYSKALKKGLGANVFPQTLLTRAQLEFGSWYAALEAAGVDTTSIRVRSIFGRKVTPVKPKKPKAPPKVPKEKEDKFRAKITLSKYQDSEAIANARGEQRSRGPTGEDTKTPEQNLLEQRNLKLIERACEDLPPRDRIIGAKILDVILNSDGMNGPEDLTQSVAQELGPEVSIEEIGRVIQALAKTPSIRLLLDK